jgi:dihydrofolate reductase / thymidylate synthase
MKLNLIVAHTFKKSENGFGIGINNKIPWNIKEDLINFKQVTSIVPSDPNIEYLNAVVMGRKTWDSLPVNYRPLPKRLNVIITTQDLRINTPDVIVSTWDNFEQSIINYQNEQNKSEKRNLLVNDVYIIGGQQIYSLALKTRSINKIYATEVYKDMQCDTFMLDYLKYDNQFNKFEYYNVGKFSTSGEYVYRFITMINTVQFSKENKPLEQITKIWQNEEEMQYLALMEDILKNGIERDDRTGTGTISTFGNTLKYNLRDTFPICTTKRIPLRFIFEELKLYLTGRTDNKILQRKNIHIWDGNTSREFLDKRGLKHYPEGDMGETYGFNMRHYGGKYEGCDKEYGQECGFDQLNYVIDLLYNNPTSRRIIIDLWNPSTLDKAALPSCLCKYQFYVNTQAKELNLMIYIRSSDYFLANNWNTCTGALFVHLLCNLNGMNLTPGELTVVVGDTHLYKTHLEQVRENLARKPYPFPMLRVKKTFSNLAKVNFEDLELIGYRAHPRISAEMAV